MASAVSALGLAMREPVTTTSCNSGVLSAVLAVAAAVCCASATCQPAVSVAPAINANGIRLIGRNIEVLPKLRLRFVPLHSPGRRGELKQGKYRSQLCNSAADEPVLCEPKTRPKNNGIEAVPLVVVRE